MLFLMLTAGSSRTRAAPLIAPAVITETLAFPRGEPTTVATRLVTYTSGQPRHRPGAGAVQIGGPAIDDRPATTSTEYELSFTSFETLVKTWDVPGT